VQKFDGKMEQYLMPHAYTQMAGRAGRRNIDTIGHVVHCNNLFPLPSPTEYKQILCGKPQPMESKFHISYATVLNLLRNGHNRFSDFCQFVNQSMMKGDLQQGAIMLRNTLQTMEQELERKKTALSCLQTPIDVLNQYMDLKHMLTRPTGLGISNKKYKEIERNLQNIKDTYHKCDAESLILQGIRNKEDEISLVERQIHHLDTSISRQFRGILSILIQQGFVCEPESDEYEFTAKGHFASQLAEIHPLVFTEMVFEHEYFGNLTTEQIVAYLSCFSDVRVQEDIMKYNPTTEDTALSKLASQLKQKMKYYEDEECFYELSTGINYMSAINYDLLDEMLLWVEYKDEISCKQFIQEKIIQEKGISVGDFVKAILKISAIAKEWKSICEFEGYISLMDKLQHVDELILKYVCTTQSLYV
jgi:ATP-dependent RNA helicase HelY